LRLGLRLPAWEGPFFYPASFDARASDYWNTVMKFDHNPKAADISALKEIIAGTSADPLTVKQLVNSDLVEELNGTAILTDKGIQIAIRLMTDAAEEKSVDA
jgi:hypothetical protein